jgi:hypothetical protein
MKRILSFFSVLALWAIFAISLEVAGTKLNCFVENKNEDRMPVWDFDGRFAVQFPIDLGYVQMSKATHWNVLGDIIPVVDFDDIGHPHLGMASAGDMAQDAGQFILLASPFLALLKAGRRQKQATK